MSPEEIAASALAGMDCSITTLTAQTDSGSRVQMSLPLSTNDDRGAALLEEVSEESSARFDVESSAIASTGIAAAVDTPNLSHNISIPLVGVTDASQPDSQRNATGTETTANKPKRRGPKPKIKLPVEPRLIQSIPKRKEYTNHSYSDYSIVPPMDPNYQPPKSIADMSFVEKVHDILSKPEYEPWIAWRPHGRAFGITVPTMFEKVVCEPYFGHKRYSSFLRQINNHGFKHLTKDGPDRNCYYHESFLRGMMYLCKYMPEPKDSRRQIPDPDNEPDFEAISRLYPVPPPNLLAASALIQSVAPPAAMASPFNTSMTTAPAAAISALLNVPAVAGSAAGSASLTTILAAMREQQQSATQAPPQPPPPKSGMDRHAALAEMQLLQARLAAEAASATTLDTPNTAVPVVVPPAPKIGMDRDTALAEIKSLGARLASEVAESDGTDAVVTEMVPTLKRKAMHESTDDAPIKQLARMPQPFPTRTKKRDVSSQIDTIIQRNMIVATMRKEQESQKQLEEQMQHQQQPTYPSNIPGLSDSEGLQLLQQQQQQQQQQQNFTANPSNFLYPNSLTGNASDIFANPMTNQLYQRKPLYSQQQQQGQQTTLLPPGTNQWNPQNFGGLRMHPSHTSRTPTSSNANAATNDLVIEYLRGSSGTQHFS